MDHVLDIEQRFLEWMRTNAPGYADLPDGGGDGSGRGDGRGDGGDGRGDGRVDGGTQRHKYAMAVGLVAHQFVVDPSEGWGSSLLADPSMAGVQVATIEAQPGCARVCAKAGASYGYQPGQVSAWGVYCCDFLLLSTTSCYFLLLLVSPARV